MRSQKQAKKMKASESRRDPSFVTSDLLIIGHTRVDDFRGPSMFPPSPSVTEWAQSVVSAVQAATNLGTISAPFLHQFSRFPTVVSLIINDLQRNGNRDD